MFLASWYFPSRILKALYDRLIVRVCITSQGAVCCCLSSLEALVSCIQFLFKKIKIKPSLGSPLDFIETYFPVERCEITAMTQMPLGFTCFVVSYVAFLNLRNHF